VIELVRYDYISHVELIVCKCRTSSTELEFFKSSTLKDRKGAEELYLSS
jgi:hypothetical protein